MSKKTVAELDKEVQQLKASAGNLKLYAGTVWNLEQLAEEITKHNTHNELIKVEVDNRNPGFKEQWDYRIYAYDTLRFEQELERGNQHEV